MTSRPYFQVVSVPMPAKSRCEKRYDIVREIVFDIAGAKL